MRILTGITALFVLLSLASPALAQDDEGDSSLSVNGYVKLQSGIFVPLLSDMFSAHEYKAFIGKTSEPCDPVMVPNKPCTPRDHAVGAGDMSMFRATLQLEADWQPYESVAVHAILRGARSLMTKADGWAQMPKPSTSTSAWVRASSSQLAATPRLRERGP